MSYYMSTSFLRLQNCPPSDSMNRSKPVKMWSPGVSTLHRRPRAWHTLCFKLIAANRSKRTKKVAMQKAAQTNLTGLNPFHLDSFRGNAFESIHLCQNLCDNDLFSDLLQKSVTTLAAALGATHAFTLRIQIPQTDLRSCKTPQPPYTTGTPHDHSARPFPLRHEE